MADAQTTRYVPAAGRAAFTRLYDPVMALTMREGAWRPALLNAVTDGLPEGGRVVDVGAGSGTFAIALAGARPDATVVAVDGDEETLAIAREKPGAERVRFVKGLADQLPASFERVDAVVLSLLLHHLAPPVKERALAEAARVLRPGGRLHVADWGRPADPVMRGAFFTLQILDGFANTRDHAAGRLPALIADAGFSGVTTTRRLRTTWGTLELLAATR